MNAPAPDLPALKVESAVKSYGTVRALDGVSLEVRVGEFVALLGPNGAGKSTLFQLLTGLFVPDDGNILMMGNDLRRDPVPALARIGVVFQQPTVDPELSVAANLRFHARLHGMPKARTEARIGEELERIGLNDRAGDKVGTLSGGNRRRVELARALLHDPEILLMDEPTVGLDPASRRELLAYVMRLRTEKRLGVLWATHLVDEVQDADRIVVLHRGKILTDTTPAELIARSGADTLESAFLKMTGGGKRGPAAEAGANAAL